MGLRFFVDQCVGFAVIDSLREAGHEVLRLRDYLPCDAPDPMVLAKAQELKAILVSLNGDFSDIVTYPPGKYRGIIALQLRNHPEVIPDLMKRLVRYLSLQPNMEHYRGKLLLVEVHRIRVRSS